MLLPGERSRRVIGPFRGPQFWCVNFFSFDADRTDEPAPGSLYNTRPTSLHQTPASAGAADSSPSHPSLAPPSPSTRRRPSRDGAPILSPTGHWRQLLDIALTSSCISLQAPKKDKAPPPSSKPAKSGGGKQKKKVTLSLPIARLFDLIEARFSGF